MKLAMDVPTDLKASQMIVCKVLLFVALLGSANSWE